MSGIRPSEEDQCRLISADGKEFLVRQSIAKQSVLIREMVEECEKGDIPDVPLPNVKGDVLKLVVEFCVHNAKDPMPDFEKPLISDVLAEFVPQWYREFIDRDRAEVFEIISCANYLDIAPLLDLACAKIAVELKRMTEKDRIETFGPPENLTPEQDALVREFNKWEAGPDTNALD
mmetsp:Transcript_6804/g.13629  ORF Transcript_6804/g.13629 Transcript_6804/m.13629 type:complete len:176 (-) Transcript_6804:645-1172(-)